MKNVSLDIETLGRKPGCVILSIGAVVFDPDTGAEGRWFYSTIDAVDSQNEGFTLDASTVCWWLAQGDAARKGVSDAKAPVRTVLENFAAWLPSGAVVWGNGSDFDNAIVSAAYDKLGMEIPWSFRGNRCLRTLRGMFPNVSVPAVGTHHNALDDAIYQARLCSAIHKEIRK